MPCGPAALEAPVQHPGPTCRGCDLLRGGLDGWRAGRAPGGADVEIGQHAVEQERDHRADRVAVVKNRHPVFRPYPFDLGGQRGMIGGVETGLAVLDLLGRRFPFPDLMPVEIGQRHQPGGVLAGIKARVVRAAVGVDDIAVEGRAHGGRAGQKPVVKPVDMPVGVGQHPTAVVQPGHDLVGQIGAGVGQAQDDRAIALRDLDRGHATSSMIPVGRAASSAPERTNWATSARSSAM